LYNRPDEVLGTERADTLMAYLPTDEFTALATKVDIERLEKNLHGEIRSVNERLDRFFLTQSAALIAMIGTLIAAILL
jgi:hypothetical protein